MKRRVWATSKQKMHAITTWSWRCSKPDQHWETTNQLDRDQTSPYKTKRGSIHKKWLWHPITATKDWSRALKTYDSPPKN